LLTLIQAEAKTEFVVEFLLDQAKHSFSPQVEL